MGSVAWAPQNTLRIPLNHPSSPGLIWSCTGRKLYFWVPGTKTFNKSYIILPKSPLLQLSSLFRSHLFPEVWQWLLFSVPRGNNKIIYTYFQKWSFLFFPTGWQTFFFFLLRWGISLCCPGQAWTWNPLYQAWLRKGVFFLFLWYWSSRYLCLLYHSSHTPQPLFCFWDSVLLTLPRLASNLWFSFLHLPRDYWCAPPCPARK
jgi:hypothetical protein